MNKNFRIFIFVIFVFVTTLYISLPNGIVPHPPINIFGKQVNTEMPLKMGLDIQGGIQVLLRANMNEITGDDKMIALDSAKEIIQRRVDLFGVSEPVVQTSVTGDEYRIVVELPGVENPDQALDLVGQTAQLDFRLEGSPSAEATQSALAFLNSFVETGLTGKNLRKSQVQFDPQTNKPTIGLEFDDEGRDKFAEITKNNLNKVLAIFIDGYPISTPVISSVILDGRAVISGDFELNEAKQLVTQLNAGALPVEIEVIEQRQIGASLGELSVQQSVRAGVIGLALVMLFMILYYGVKGVIATLALIIYTSITIAVYKMLGVTLTLPGIAGLILSIGMAVDANILIFERMKEELRVGQPFERALELGFGRAWDSIKDANLATIITALILINPLNFTFLNSSGLVKGFGITLLIGVLVSLFTGVVVTRNLMRVFLPVIKFIDSRSLK